MKKNKHFLIDQFDEKLKDVMDLIEQMLEINPYMRPSSLECLTSGAFKAEVSELGIKDR